MPRSLSRRDLLIGGAALGVAVVAAACQQTPDAKPEVDDLLIQIDLAQRDATSAAAAATANAELAPALTAVAAIRRAHGVALTKELARIPGATTTTPPSSTTTSPASPPPQLEQIKTQLKDSSKSAMDLATKQSGYRAGLLASISASCASAAEVDLP
ncbi:hypothetical protein DE4585_01371 [Mycobacteroides salmoniphilum]|uniref:Tat pathway signal sequence domain protein n=1 Tax=Mycobacteroides salmoniphilum TaxID=404941 RepID=A0A4R8S5V6_9MYCO|nr:hypothetical protein [Mycobacteroides salmoniphilum]TDZ77117.1 hypothetical protein DE4586_02903 [Mycobacteroides salmoniphilum]TDZ86048.1 hypothetical protein DE4585_01371 [Mycobacteroides salmoniphilum]TDZ86820.1 hypothetical protein DE4587_02207 [Mycobacteroides salmoniphilum]